MKSNIISHEFVKTDFNSNVEKKVKIQISSEIFNPILARLDLNSKYRLSQVNVYFHKMVHNNLALFLRKQSALVKKILDEHLSMIEKSDTRIQFSLLAQVVRLNHFLMKQELQDLVNCHKTFVLFLSALGNHLFIEVLQACRSSLYWEKILSNMLLRKPFDLKNNQNLQQWLNQEYSRLQSPDPLLIKNWAAARGLKYLQPILATAETASPRAPELLNGLLDWAAAAGQLEVVQFLVNQYHWSVQELRSATFFSITNGHNVIFDFLKKTWLAQDPDPMEALKKIIDFSVLPFRTELCLALLNDRPPQFLKDYNARLCHAAARYDQSVLWHKLFKLGFNLSLEYAGYKPMHVAALNGHTQSLETLIQLGVDVAEFSSLSISKSPLKGLAVVHLAAYAGQLAVLEMLRRKKIALDGLSHQRATALFYAAIAGHVPVAKFLLTNGVFPNTQDQQGCTALHVAVSAAQEDMVLFLMHWPMAEVHIKNAQGHIPLHLAILHNHEKIAQMLLRYTVLTVINFTDQQNRTPLQDAARLGQVSLVAALLRKGASLHSEDLEKNNNAFHDAALNGHLAVLQLLLEKAEQQGRNELLKWLYNCNKDGNNILHLAAQNGHQHLVEYLVNVHEMDTSTLNYSGKSPCNLAEDNNYSNIVQFLCDTEQLICPSAPQLRRSRPDFSNTTAHVGEQGTAQGNPPNIGPGRSFGLFGLR